MYNSTNRSSNVGGVDRVVAASKRRLQVKRDFLSAVTMSCRSTLRRSSLTAFINTLRALGKLQLLEDLDRLFVARSVGFCDNWDWSAWVVVDDVTCSSQICDIVLVSAVCSRDVQLN